MTCRHCGQPVAETGGRWAHVTTSRAHGHRAMPSFVTCPTGRNVATPRQKHAR